MKTLFFFRSSSSSGNNSTVFPPLERGASNQAEKSKIKKKVPENRIFDSVPSLRRSVSYSSGSYYDAAPGQVTFSSKIELPLKQSDHPSYPQAKAKCFGAAAVHDTRGGVKKPDRIASFRAQYDTSESSSYCSSNSSKFLDRYIDGEQQEQTLPRRSNGCNNGKHPLWMEQHTAPASPTAYSLTQEPNSHSFRATKDGQAYCPSRDSTDNVFGHESPGRLARHVFKRLSQSRVLRKSCSEEFDPAVPITIEDIYSGSLNRCSYSNNDGASYNSFQLDNSDEIINGCHLRESSGFKRRDCLSGGACGGSNFVQTEEDIDEELLRRSKKAQERAMLLLSDLEQENFLQGSGFSVSAMIQTIRSLMEERVNMAFEISAALQNRMTERDSTWAELEEARVELDSRTRRLEKEKKELKSALEKELSRRSSEWALKLEKYQAEEQRLRDRVRELAEQNVFLQREISSFSEKEIDSRCRITCAEGKIKDLTASVEQLTKGNENLQQRLSESQRNYRTEEEGEDCIRRNYEEKEKECKELHRSVTRLLRTCSEQEKTINALKEGLSEEFKNKTSLANFNSPEGELQMELMRLTGVEHALRKEMESYRADVDSLQHENIRLLQHLKSSGKESGFFTLKVDQELYDRVQCLQGQGLSSLNESNQLCSKLLEYIKEKSDVMNGVDGQFFVKSDMKLQGLSMEFENLTKSLRTVTCVLHGKTTLNFMESQAQRLREDFGEPRGHNWADIRSELKAETLLTSLLRDKLYSAELNMQQLQAELAAEVRGNDILRCEVQNAMNTISCITHKMSDLELQLITKDENINQLQNRRQECINELATVRGILPKVSEERDLMWEEMKQCSEEKMLLNSEIKLLKKKIEALDEDVLLKEGQITILKDAIGKPFDLLATLN